MLNKPGYRKLFQSNL